MEIRLIRPEDRIEWVRMRNLLWPGARGEHEIVTQRFFVQPDESLATFVVDWHDRRLGGFIEVGRRKYAEGCTSSPVAYADTSSAAHAQSVKPSAQM